MSQSSRLHTSPSASVPSAPRASRASRANTNVEVRLDGLLYQYLQQAQGGRLYPEHIVMNSMRNVLDMPCGSGEWLFDLASRYPKLHMYGIDYDETLLNEATVRRNLSSLHQVELRHMNMLEGLQIPNDFFNFVHLYRVERILRPQEWPFILRECVRVLAPGGWLNVVETELGELSSPACQSLYRLMLQVRAKLGHSLSSKDPALGVVARLYAMLLEIGLYDVGYEVYMVDMGAMDSTLVHHFLSELIKYALSAEQFVVEQGILKKSMFDGLIAQAKIELKSPVTCGWLTLLSAYGRYGEADASST